MNESKISVRYAKALFTAGKEDNSLDVLKHDIDILLQSIMEIPEVQHIIESPVIKASQKVRLFNVAFKDVFSPLTFTFLGLVIENHREDFLAGISRYFLGLFRAEQNIQSAEFITATEIDAKTRDSVIRLIAKKFRATVDLRELTDQRIIGGFILRVGDEQIDASIASKLSRIKKELTQTQS